MHEEFFSSLKNQKVLLLCHEHADLDSVCSAAIMQRILKSKKINSVIGVPAHANEQASNFFLREKINFVAKPDLEKYSAVLCFDFNDFDQLGALREEFELLLNKKAIRVLSFDHHIAEKTSIDSTSVFVKKAFSTTQLLLDTFSPLFDLKCFFYCALGLIEDTGHFSVGDEKLFLDFSKCLSLSKKSFAEVLSFSKHIVKKGERIALLKAASRTEINEINDVVVASSTVSFFQSQAATKLLDFGADISLVSGFDERANLSVLSCRANSLFKQEKKFNLVRDLLVPLQSRIGGEIGGHSGAAQWKGNYDYLLVLQESMSILHAFFK